MAAQPFDVGTGFKRGFEAFQSRLKDFIVLAVVFGVAQGIFIGIAQLLVGIGDASSGGDGAGLGFLGASLFFVVIQLVVNVVVAVLAYLYLTRVALSAVDGDQRPLGELIKAANARLGAWVGWGLLMFLLIFVGVILCVIPGLVVGFFLAFVPFIVIDHKSSENPLSGSFNAVKDNWVNVLIVVVVVGIGQFLAGIIAGIFGAIPVLGPVIQGVVTFLIYAVAQALYAPVFRSTAIGGGVAAPAYGQPIPPYPGAEGYGQQPPAAPGYPPQDPGYPPQAPPPAPGYPPQDPGYPPQAPPPAPGYPPQDPGYPPQ